MGRKIESRRHSFLDKTAMEMNVARLARLGAKFSLGQGMLVLKGTCAFIVAYNGPRIQLALIFGNSCASLHPSSHSSPPTAPFSIAAVNSLVMLSALANVFSSIFLD